MHGERAATRFTRWSTPRDVGVRTAGDGPAIRHLEAVRAAGMRGAGEVVRCVRVARVVRWRISRLEPCSPVLGGARLPHHLPATRAPCPHRPSPARVGPRRGVVGDGLDTAFPHASEDPAAAPPAPRRTKSRFRRETGISARVRRRRRRTRARMPDSRLRQPNATSSNRTHRGTGPISSRNSTDLDAKGVADAGARGVDQTS